MATKCKNYVTFTIMLLILFTLMINVFGCNAFGYKVELLGADTAQRIITLGVKPSGFEEGSYSIELINQDGTRAATSPLRWSSEDLRGDGKILKLSLPSRSSDQFINAYLAFEGTWMMIGLREGIQSLGNIESYSDLKNRAESLDSKAKSDLQELFREYFSWEIKKAR